MSVYDIWYMKPEWFPNGIMGKAPDKGELSKTHVLLKTIAASEGGTLDNVYEEMQAENWSPNGEARDLIDEKGLGHTTMSVGDVIVKDGETFVVHNIGFKRL